MLIFNAQLETKKYVSVQGFSQFHRSLISKDGKSSSLPFPIAWEMEKSRQGFLTLCWVVQGVLSWLQNTPHCNELR